MKAFHLLSLSLFLATMPLSAGGSACAAAHDMQHAILAGPDLKRIESLLQSGFDPQQPIGCGTYDALDGAVDTAHPETAELLLQHGAHPKASTFVNAAFIASHEQALRIVRAFLTDGCSVNSKDGTGATALHRAVWRQNLELVSLLLSQKDISLDCLDIDDRTPLMIAVEKCDKRFIEMLLKAGADSSAKNSKGMTAADCSQAIIENQREVQSLLTLKAR